MTKQAATARPDNNQLPSPSTSPTTAPSNGGGGRMAGEERRQQIVCVAMRVFSDRGFRGTTTKEIAQAAGVSEAIIFRHFATKEELYTAIIDHKACAGAMAHMKEPFGTMQQSVAEAIQCRVADAMGRKDDRAVFEGIATAMMRHHNDDREFLRLLFYSALEGHQLSQMFWDRNVRLLYEFLGAYIRERQHDGSFRVIDPLVVVRAFSGMIIHHSVTNLLWDTSRKLLDISNETASREFTDILLRGIAADPTTAPTTSTTTTKAHAPAGTRRESTRRAGVASAAAASAKASTPTPPRARKKK